MKAVTTMDTTLPVATAKATMGGEIRIIKGIDPVEMIIVAMVDGTVDGELIALRFNVILMKEGREIPSLLEMASTMSWLPLCPETIALYFMC